MSACIYTFFPNTLQVAAIRNTLQSTFCRDDKQLIIFILDLHSRCCSDNSLWVITKGRI